MSTTISEQKQALRRTLKAREQSLSAQALRASDDALFARFLSWVDENRPTSVGLFWGMGAEPDTARLVQELTKRSISVALPRCLPGNEMEFRIYDPAIPMVRHRYGMWEPSEEMTLISVKDLPVLLVPALCYDVHCGRMGRGGGFYDRCLKEYTGIPVGLCREALLQERVPMEVHDQRVQIVWTERAMYTRDEVRCSL